MRNRIESFILIGQRQIDFRYTGKNLPWGTLYRPTGRLADNQNMRVLAHILCEMNK